MKNINKYAICRACGQKFDSSSEFCPNCRLKINKEDIVYECSKCHAKLKATENYCEKCFNKHQNENALTSDIDEPIAADFILYIFGLFLIFNSLVNEEISTLNKTMLIVFSLSLFKFMYKLLFIKFRNKETKLYFRIFIPVALLIIWFFLSFTQSRNEYDVPNYNTTTKVTTTEGTKNITIINTKTTQSKKQTTIKKTNTAKTATSAITTTAKKDFLVRLYYGTNSKEYKDYWMNKGESFTFPVNDASRSKTEKGVLYLYPNPDQYTKYETYKSYTTYEPDGWMYNGDKSKKFESNQTIIINSGAIFVPHFKESVECAKVKKPTREGYTFIGWAATTSGDSGYQITEWCGYSDVKGSKWYGMWSKNE